jgi:hypothetical protein
MTVREATLKAYNDMPDEFHILQLCKKVKVIIGRQHLMDGSITRRLRELREDGVIRYDVVETRHSIYQKNGQLNLFSR